MNSIAKSSTEDESFVTASECTLTPHSHSSSYETASEGGLMSPWWTSGTDKNSFETCSSSLDSEVPSMQLLTGVFSSTINTFYDSDTSFQSICNSSDDLDDDLSNDRKSKSLDQDLSDVFIKATKHTVKGCL